MGKDWRKAELDHLHSVLCILENDFKTGIHSSRCRLREWHWKAKLTLTKLFGEDDSAGA